MMIYYLITGIAFGASWLVGKRLKSKFKEYSQVPMKSGMSGKEVAEKMLRDNGISDVKVISVPGQLTDHYNPQNKTVNLSDWVYGQQTVAAAAVAAHECGHAVQHATEYSFLAMRSNLVPIVSKSSRFMGMVLMVGIGLAYSGIPWVLGLGIIMFALTTLFSFVTLPVEFDASRRALVWLDKSGITSGIEHDKAQNALKWAAMTYVVAALASLGQLLYFVYIFMGSRR